MDWLTFSISALTGLCFGSILGVHIADHAARTFSSKVWSEIMAKRVDVERTLSQAQADVARHTNGGFDLGPRA
jgi:hypothetical protein